MAFIRFNGEGKPRARNLRTGLDQLRDGLYRLRREMDDMNQMSDVEIADQYEVSPNGDNSQTAAQMAATLKAELASDIGKLTTDAQVTNVQAALSQLFAMTG